MSVWMVLLFCCGRWRPPRISKPCNRRRHTSNEPALCSGPTKLAQAMGVTGILDGTSLFEPSLNSSLQTPSKALTQARGSGSAGRRMLLGGSGFREVPISATRCRALPLVARLHGYALLKFRGGGRRRAQTEISPQSLEAWVGPVPQA